MNLLKQINLLLSFLLEIMLLIMAGYWGFKQSENPVEKYILAIFLPVAIVALWGIFAAPKSNHRLKNPKRTVFKLIMFFVTVLFSCLTGHYVLALIIAVLIILNFMAARIFSQDY